MVCVECYITEKVSKDDENAKMEVRAGWKGMCKKAFRQRLEHKVKMSERAIKSAKQYMSIGEELIISTIGPQFKATLGVKLYTCTICLSPLLMQS